MTGINRKIPPIPKYLLPHAVEYQQYKGTGTFGEEWEAPIIITGVRVEPTNRKLTISAGGATVRDVVSNALVFIDMVNSSHTEIKAKSKMMFAGKLMKVEVVEVLYGFDGITPHHLEVYLV